MFFEESMQSKVLKFFGEHFFRPAYEGSLDLVALRKGDLKTPQSKHINPCTIEEVDIAGCKTLRLTPERVKDSKVIMHIHGGAYVSGPTIFHWKMLAKLVDITGFIAYVPNYRLAPEHCFTEGASDVLNVYQYLQNKYTKRKLIVSGDSAGGGLAVSTALQARDKGWEQAEKLVLLSPWLDLTLKNPDIAEFENQDVLLAKEGLCEAGNLWAGATYSLAHPYLSPVNADLTGLPPMMLQIGTHDILLPDSRRFKANAEKAGITLNYMEAEGMCHAWMAATPFVPEANRALEKVVSFIKEEV